MIKQSAGLLPFRFIENHWEIFLVHPGGPFWQKKDLGAWSIAKGEILEGEDPLCAARREFTEETGFVATGEVIALGEIQPYRGKNIHAWALDQSFDPQKMKSNRFQLEWPPRSGRMAEFPEVDRADWFSFPLAAEKFSRGQVGWIDRLRKILPIEGRTNP